MFIFPMDFINELAMNKIWREDICNDLNCWDIEVCTLRIVLSYLKEAFVIFLGIILTKKFEICIN